MPTKRKYAVWLVLLCLIGVGCKPSQFSDLHRARTRWVYDSDFAPGKNRNVYVANSSLDLNYGMIEFCVDEEDVTPIESVVATALQQCRADFRAAYGSDTLEYYDSIAGFRHFKPRYVLLLIIGKSASSQRPTDAPMGTAHYRATGYVFDAPDVFGTSSDYAMLLRKAFIYTLPNDFSDADAVAVISRHKESMKP
jgi:hypothetical protein